MRPFSPPAAPRLSTRGTIAARFLHRIFRPCRRTREASRELPHENCFHRCALSAGADVYGLWTELVSSFYPPVATDKSTGNPVPCCHQRIALCRVLPRGAGPWWAAAALRLFRATSADTACCGTLQHPCVSPDTFAGRRSGTGGQCAVGAGLPSVPRKLRWHLQREAGEAGLRRFAYPRAAARKPSPQFSLHGGIDAATPGARAHRRRNRRG